MGVGLTDSELAQHFWLRKTRKFFLCFWQGLTLGSFDLELDALPSETPPMICFSRALRLKMTISLTFNWKPQCLQDLTVSSRPNNVSIFQRMFQQCLEKLVKDYDNFFNMPVDGHTTFQAVVMQYENFKVRQGGFCFRQLCGFIVFCSSSF